MRLAFHCINFAFTAFTTIVWLKMSCNLCYEHNSFLDLK
nr:MAG TPA: hypothetical protein [Caudoviricetes sp.]